MIFQVSDSDSLLKNISNKETLELAIPYKMDESCNFRILTPTPFPFSKISLTVTIQESRVMTLGSSIHC